MDFSARYKQNIAGIAAVGDPKWETDMLIFLAAGHRKGAVRYLTPEDESKARAWLAE